MQLYTEQSSYPLVNAQRNLIGRTHYVDPDTLRFHKSRVMRTKVIAEGLLFAIITSDSLNYENTKRGFRYVVFDVFGTVVARAEMENARRTKEQATKDMWTAVNAIDARAVTLAAIERAERNHAEEMTILRGKVNPPSQQAA